MSTCWCRVIIGGGALVRNTSLFRFQVVISRVGLMSSGLVLIIGYGAGAMFYFEMAFMLIVRSRLRLFYRNEIVSRSRAGRAIKYLKSSGIDKI